MVAYVKTPATEERRGRLRGEGDKIKLIHKLHKVG